MTNKSKPPAVASGGSSVVKLPTMKNLMLPYQTLADLADRLVERMRSIQSESRSLSRLYQCDLQPYDRDIVLPDIDDLMLSDQDRADIERATAMFETLNPEHAYEHEDEDGNTRLKRPIIAERLALLLGSFPNAQASNPDGYASMLLEHVASGDTLLPALYTACAELEKGRATVPAISAVLDTIAKHDEAWMTRRNAVFHLHVISSNRVEWLIAVRKKLSRYRHVCSLESAQYWLGVVKDRLARKQAEAANLAGEIANDYDDLMRAEAAIDNAKFDIAADEAADNADAPSNIP